MSDQAERIAIEIFYRIKGAVFMGGLPTYDKLPPYVRAEVDVIACLIRSAAPSSALVDAANKAIDSSHSDNPQDWLDAIDALRAALSEQKPRVCEWVDDDPFWIISCQKVGLSHSFHEPVIVRKWKACPYCTNPIEVKESDVRQGGKG